MGKVGVRSLDTALPASIDHIALNNQVVGMRKTVKKTKLQLINRMVKRIRVLKNYTKGSEEEIAKRRRKADRIIQEIDVLKKLDPDQVSKYALSSTSTVKDLADQPSGSLTKGLVQYSSHKLMQDLVGKFREKHPDWKALAAYLLAKNTGRRYKKKVTKEKVTADAAATKRETRDNLLNNFLQQKGAEDTDILKPSNTLKQKNTEKKTKADSLKELSVSELKKSVETFHESGESSDESVDETEDISNIESISESDDEINNESNDESNNESSDELNQETPDESKIEPNSNSKVTDVTDIKMVTNVQQKEKPNSQKRVLKTKITSQSVAAQTKDKKPVEIKRQNKHMVIQSFSLENSSIETLPVEITAKTKLTKDSSEMGSDENIIVPSFLTLNDSAAKSKRVKKDSFFMGGEDEDDSGTESIVENNDGDSGSDLEENDQLQKGKIAMRSTFVGSLTDNRKDKMSTWATSHSTVRAQGGHGGFNTRTRSADDNFQQNSRGSRGGFHSGGRGNGDRRSGQGDRWSGQGDRWSSQGDRRSGRGRGDRRSTQGDRWSGHGDRRSGTWGSNPQGDRLQKQPYQNRENTGDNHANSKKTEGEEKIHPSWQASKLRKQQTGTIQSFKGKKTTFDDD